MAPFLQTSLPYSIAGSRRTLVDVRRITDLPAREPRDENHKVYVMELFIAQRARGNWKPCPCSCSNSRVIYFPHQLTFSDGKVRSHFHWLVPCGPTRGDSGSEIW